MSAALAEPRAGTTAAAAPPVIELRGVTKTYGSGAAAVHALRGIDLRIDAGEFVAVMGPSGSGKSTCMNIVGCLDVPSAGAYRFDGVDVGGLSRRQRALLRRNFLGFVFQGYNLLNRTTALENVELPLVYRGLRPPRAPPAGVARARDRRARRRGRTTRRASSPAASSSASRSRARSSPSRP